MLGRFSSSTDTYTATSLSTDHNVGSSPTEVARVRAEHPGEEDVIKGDKPPRLLGIAVTRAFGDGPYKWVPEIAQAHFEKFWGKPLKADAKTPPYLTAEPDVVEVEIGAGDFLIMGSDGFWDHVSNENAVEIVKRWLAANHTDRFVSSSSLSKSDSNPNPTTAYNPPIHETTDNRNRFIISQEPPKEEHIVPAPAPAPAPVEGYNWEWWEHDAQIDPADFVIERGENVATCLVKNALGGRNEDLLTGVVGTEMPQSRDVRDDITVQVVFFSFELEGVGRRG